jgi:hypothetical protein
VGTPEPLLAWHPHTEVMTRTTAMGLAALFVCVPACSSGGAKTSSATTTTKPLATTTLGRVTRYSGGLDGKGVTPSHLGPCPKTFPRASLQQLNAGVTGLERALVPIVVVKVRLCEYSPNDSTGGQLPLQLVASGLLTSKRAVSFEQNTNRLSRQVGPIFGSQGPPEPVEFVTFASDAHHVSIDDGAGLLTNGAFVAKSTASWYDVLSLVQSATQPK